jgi:hypothetical protein
MQHHLYHHEFSLSNTVDCLYRLNIVNTDCIIVKMYENHLFEKCAKNVVKFLQVFLAVRLVFGKHMGYIPQPENTAGSYTHLLPCKCDQHFPL